MPLPLAAVAIPAIGSFISSWFGNKSQSRQAQLDRQAALDRLRMQLAAEEKRAQDDIDYKRGRDQQQTALDESKLDPWRYTMAQLRNSSMADRLSDPSSMAPSQITLGSRGAVTRTGGGAGYQADPAMLAAAKAAMQLMLTGGGRVPTMTDPGNYGQTGLYDLTSPTDGRGVPTRTVDPARTPTRRPARSAGAGQTAEAQLAMRRGMVPAPVLSNPWGG